MIIVYHKHMRTGVRVSNKLTNSCAGAVLIGGDYVRYETKGSKQTSRIGIRDRSD